METKKNQKVPLYDLVETAFLAGEKSVDFYFSHNGYCYTAKVCDIESWTSPVLVKLDLLEETIHYTFPAFFEVYAL